MAATGHIFQHTQDFVSGLLRPRHLPRPAIVVDEGEMPAAAVTWSDLTVLTWGDGTIVTWSNA